MEKIREEHNEITYEMIITSISPNNHYLSLGLIPDPDLVESVATVAAGHRKRDLTASEYTPFIFEDGIIRPQLLATLLRIGDGLDIDHRRVKMENLKLAQISALSRFHWYKCYYISGVWVLDEFIHIGYRFPPDSEYENLISPLVENNIRDELANFEAFLRSHNAKLSIAESTFRLIPTIEEMPEDVIDFAKQELQKQTERKKNIQSPSLPVDDLTKEVTRWIKAMGYEVINRDRVGNWCINLFVVNESGLLPHKAIIACLDGEINVNRIQSLEPIINKHNVQQCWIICDKRIAQSARDYVSDNQTIQVFTLAEFLNEIFGHYFNYITGIVEDSDIKQYYINLRCKKPI
ncbi:MAG: hypothetical protein OEZ02_15430, partial [Anaerolineae bacterium]|nr:hypothetical protein [Anaerolineae bacterium]